MLCGVKKHFVKEQTLALNLYKLNHFTVSVYSDALGSTQSSGTQDREGNTNVIAALQADIRNVNNTTCIRGDLMYDQAAVGYTGHRTSLPGKTGLAL